MVINEKLQGLAKIIGKKGLSEQLSKNRRSVGEFCRKYHLNLLKLGMTDENGKPEIMYYFSDELGGYTIEGIKKSLEEYNQESDPWKSD